MYKSVNEKVLKMNENTVKPIFYTLKKLKLGVEKAA